MKPNTTHPSYSDEIMRKFESIWVIKFAFIAQIHVTWGENVTETYVTSYKTVAEISFTSKK